MAASVRARTTIVAVIVVGVAVAGTALLFVTLMRRSLTDDLWEKALLRAHIVAATLESGTDPSALDLGHEDDVFIQVVDESGRLVAASPSLRATAPVARDPGPDGTVVSGDAFGESGESFLVVRARADTASGAMDVLVGRNLDPVAESTSLAASLLAFTAPFLVLVAGLMTWALAGRALLPVEAIRSEVAEISATDLNRRVPVPGGDDEIARLARTMNEMLIRLERSHVQRELFVSDASHELRNPIAAIRHHAEVALAHPDRTDVTTLAQGVLDEDLRLHQIAEDLLLLARADERVLEIRRTELDLDDIVLEEARRLRSTTSLNVDTSGVGAARLRGDSRSLERAIRNLADNAAHHARSTVSFALREEGSKVVFEIDDDGVGIPPEHRVEIFERFRRLDPARGRADGGAGLGLAIVEAVVASHGGTAQASDGHLGGARFVIVLPASIA